MSIPCPKQKQTLHFLERMDGSRIASEIWDNFLDHISHCDSCKELLEEYPTADSNLLKDLQNILNKNSVELLPLVGGAPKYPEYVQKRIAEPDRPTHIGRYRILSQYRGGGMGVVYRVFDPLMHKELALKMVRKEKWSREFQELFHLEISRLAQLKHEHIVPIHHCDQIDGFTYFTMDIASQGSLANHLHRFQEDQVAAVKLLARVAGAVHHVHQRQIIHRDLKPENILLDDNDKPLVSDFGLASFNTGDSSGTSHGGGTLPYMAPEQISRSGEISPQTDIWALGVILYELLVGRRPFQPSSPSLRNRQTYEDLICHSEANRPTEVRRGFCRNLEVIIQQCLKKNPTERYTSADALAADLQRWLDGEPLAGQRPPWRMIIRKWVKQHSILTSIIAAIFFGFVLTGSVWLMSGEVTDPTRLVRQMQLEIAQGKTIDLLKNNRPRFINWPLEEGQIHRRYESPDLFTYRTAARLGVLEILPEIKASAYRLEAEIRHDSGREGDVGLVLFVTRLQHPLGPFFAFATLEFNDLENKFPRTKRNPLCVYVYCTRNYEVGLAPNRMSTRAQLVNRLSFEPGLKDLGNNPWRKVSVVVTPQTLMVTLDQTQQQSFDIQSEIVREMEAKFLMGNNAAGMNSFQFGSGLGLYSSQSLASFRNVTLQPLDLK